MIRIEINDQKDPYKPLLSYNTVFKMKNTFSIITSRLHTSCV